MYPIRTPAVKKSTLDHRSSKAYLIDFTDLLHGQTEVLIGGHHTNGVGVAHTATPSLDADDRVALVDDSELETVVDTPLEATVDILLPDLDVEVRLALGEVERPHTAVQVGVLKTIVSKERHSNDRMGTYAGSGVVASDHQDGADGAVLRHKAGGFATMDLLV